MPTGRKVHAPLAWLSWAGALDKTPEKIGEDQNKNPVFVPRSVALGRSCQLPSGLSGDP